MNLHHAGRDHTPRQMPRLRDPGDTPPLCATSLETAQVVTKDVTIPKTRLRCPDKPGCGSTFTAAGVGYRVKDRLMMYIDWSARSPHRRVSAHMRRNITPQVRGPAICGCDAAELTDLTAGLAGGIHWSILPFNGLTSDTAHRDHPDRPAGQHTAANKDKSNPVLRLPLAQSRSGKSQGLAQSARRSRPYR